MRCISKALVQNNTFIEAQDIVCLIDWELESHGKDESDLADLK